MRSNAQCKIWWRILYVLGPFWAWWWRNSWEGRWHDEFNWSTIIFFKIFNRELCGEMCLSVTLSSMLNSCRMNSCSVPFWRRGVIFHRVVFHTWSLWNCQMSAVLAPSAQTDQNTSLCLPCMTGLHIGFAGLDKSCLDKTEDIAYETS